ncbi:hypothetical protein LTR37_015388 [Vermiconidia calcicola]|uniref:Uncharacterized protein n=1 Tax=Vermiconidia calcicola TaxID=1690605 RepID=A0ACC3MQW0_9PEZI|nr:hypothetical protein LTR37_015388 [Vermiconidia calcicola]
MESSAITHLRRQLKSLEDDFAEARDEAVAGILKVISVRKQRKGESRRRFEDEWCAILLELQEKDLTVNITLTFNRQDVAALMTQIWITMLETARIRANHNLPAPPQTILNATCILFLINNTPPGMIITNNYGAMAATRLILWGVEGVTKGVLPCFCRKLRYMLMIPVQNSQLTDDTSDLTLGRPLVSRMNAEILDLKA